MNSQTIFHLVPKRSPRAEAALAHPDNKPFVSTSSPRPSQHDAEGDGEDGPRPGLEVGYHVAARPRPEIIVEVGRNADLILPAPSISSVQFSFEIHPESKAIVFHDRSRYHNTTIQPFGFRTDGNIRQHVLQPGVPYVISAGGERGDLYSFEVRWVEAQVAVERAEQGCQTAAARAQNPRWARTVDEGPTELSSWYNTRLHTPAAGGVQRCTVGERLGEGAYGEVRRAVDLDSGCYVAVKKIVLSKINLAPSDLGSSIMREVKTLSSLSHKNIVEYLGSNGWGTGTIYIYTSLKAGNVNQLLERFPQARSHSDTLNGLLRQMLEALDYLAFRGLCHRDVKPDNILYTLIDNRECLFQLADFGFANQKDLARTYCGSPMFMAPEMYFHKHPQTPKLDVWSLFVTIMSITRIAGFGDKRLGRYEEVLDIVRTAATTYHRLSPMAREDPALRASAAQMLVHCFQGDGLTTPRGRVVPILPAGDSPSRSQDPSLQPKAPAKPDAIRKRPKLALKQSMNRRDKARLFPVNDRVRKDVRRVSVAFPQFA